MRLELRVPSAFRFRTTVMSHGWSELAPFRSSDDGARLHTTLDVGRSWALPVEMCSRGERIVVSARRTVDAGVRRRVRGAVSRIFNVDLDLEPFYAAIRGTPRLDWVERAGAGRLLRAPSSFEDLVKLVLTTNCSWALTRRMVAAIVDRLGVPAADGSRSFPRPAALAGFGADALRAECGLGYRAPYVAELARRVARRRPDPERWEKGSLAAEALRSAMLELPGVGPYVAENMFKLFGRPDGLGLDSWLRSRYAAVYHGGRRVGDRTIARRYRGAGSWAGLALWCDMSSDWMPRETEER